MDKDAAGPKLKRLRERAGMTVRETAEAIGRPSSSYASYEDKFKKPWLPVDLVRQLVPVFGRRGVPEADTMALAGVGPPSPPWGSGIDLRTPTDLAEMIQRTLSRGELDDALILAERLVERLRMLRALLPRAPGGDGGEGVGAEDDGRPVERPRQRADR